MASFNKVYLIGNLTRDPELRYTPSGIAVVNLRIAVNRRYKDKAGELKDEVCYVTVIAWDKQAEVCNQYLKKGRPVFVEGRLQSRSWETPDGQNRSVIDVRAEKIQFLGTAREAGVSHTPPVAAEVSESEGQAAEPAKSESVTWDEEENVV